MSKQDSVQRAPAERRTLPVWWMTIAVFAIVIAYADGFWVTSMQGAVGAIERQQNPPLERWLRDSSLMLPFFFLAVLAAVLIARRLVGHHRGLVKFGTTALLITLLSSGVAAAQMTASSAYDYHLQTQHLVLEEHLGHNHVAVPAGTALDQTTAGTCTGLCSAERDTFNVHVRAVLYGSWVMLITNLVLVLFVLALRSNRLWRRPDSKPMNAAPAVPKNWSVA
jgi:hypothetical protein